MDPLSITASVLTVLAAAGRVGTCLEKLLSLVDAPKELAALMNEISEFKCLLNIVHDAARSIEDSASGIPDAFENLRPLIARAGQYIQKLEELVEYQLKRSEGPDQKGRPRVSRSAWLKAQNKLNALRRHLRDCQLNLSTAFSAVAAFQEHSYRNAQLKTLLNIQDIILLGEARASQRISAMAIGAESIQHRMDEIMSLLKSRPVTAHAQFPYHASHDPSPMPDSHKAFTQNSEISRTTESERLSSSFDTYTPSSLCVKATIWRYNCPTSCRCRCHIRTQLSTPRWMKSIFGSFFGSFSGYPLLGSRPCNYSLCCQKGLSTTQVLYIFPVWFALRAIAFSATWNDLSGPGASWTFRMPRIIDGDSSIWGIIAASPVSKVQEAFEKHQASPYGMSNDGVTLLHHAFYCLRLDICIFLLHCGADLHSQDNYGRSPIGLAIESLWMKGASFGMLQSDLRRLIVDEDDTFEGKGFTLLHKIILGLTGGNLFEQLQLDDSAIDVPDSQGCTPLYYATVQNDVEALRTLLDRGAKPQLGNNWGQMPLHRSVLLGFSDCTKLLLDNGAPVDAADLNGQTPLHMATERNDIWTARALIARGADIEAPSVWGQTPIMDGLCTSATNVTELLVKEGARLDRLNTANYNILHLVAAFGNWHAIKFLGTVNLRGIDPQARNKKGYTPLDVFSLSRFQPTLITAEEVTTELQRAFKDLIAKAQFSWMEEVQGSNFEDDRGINDKLNTEERLASDVDTIASEGNPDSDSDIFIDVGERPDQSGNSACVSFDLNST